LNKSATFDHFCSQNEILQSAIYIPITATVAIANIASHFNITIRAEPSAKTNAYIHRQIDPNNISHKSDIPTFVQVRNHRGFTGKLR
jgi:hypothetical protein